MKGGYQLSVAFVFDKEEDTYAFAYAMPYTYSQLQDYLSRLDSMRFVCWNQIYIYICIERERERGKERRERGKERRERERKK